MKLAIERDLRITDISDYQAEYFKNKASVDNSEYKDRAIREHVWDAYKLPDEIPLYEEENGHLILPRGMLDEILHTEGLDLDVRDFRTHNKNKSQSASIEPQYTEDQREAIKHIMFNQQGRIIAPTGSGKTIIGLGALTRLGTKSLILVDKINIANQWQYNATKHFGLELGLIGDGNWHEKWYTVATVQTIWSRIKELNEDWWKQWGAVILDEQHHIPSMTYFRIVSKFPAAYRIGLSATVGKNDAAKKVSRLVFGPILYESQDQPIKPVVNVVETDFEFEYRETRRVHGRVIRNNYQKMIKALVEDKHRNRMIANLVCANNFNCNLIISRRLQHLKDLRQLCIDCGMPEDRCWMLTGKESAEQRQEIYEMADNSRCAIFSTIAFEALDIPRIDRIYLAYPIRNEESLKQVVGRGTRQHQHKESCIIYDIRDTHAGVLQNQFRSRLKLYQKQQLQVERIIPKI